MPPAVSVEARAVAPAMTPSAHSRPLVLGLALRTAGASPLRLGLLALGCAFWALAAPASAQGDAWQQRHDRLVSRLRLLQAKEAPFGPAYQPLYRAALPWYEKWGGSSRDAVDTWMASPEDYGEQLADAMEHGRNFFADNPGSLLPLVFEWVSRDGKPVSSKYWIKLPAGFPGKGRAFPLVINLHGSGWIGHKISYVHGDKPAGPFIEVTPILEGGAWEIDFLNAYMDRLCAAFPVDRDRVYLQGHSLGAIATWEWALNNPERFAAISPRAGIGEPYRALRLKNVPSWAIDGADDDVVPTGYPDQMVTALQSCGASVTYTLLKGSKHNMPDDFDDQPVSDWYLRQTRSLQAPPPDPREGLGLGQAGFSPWEVISLPEHLFYRSAPMPIPADPAEKGDDDDLWQAERPLFDRVHANGEIVDSPVRLEFDPVTGSATLWLAEPTQLRSTRNPDLSLVTLPARKVVRFYFRGKTANALEHLKTIVPDVAAAGLHLSDKVWITPLSLWRGSPGYVAEYWVETR
jgi:hypothetical protein